MFHHKGLDFLFLPAATITCPRQEASSAKPAAPGKAGAAQRPNRTSIVQLGLDPVCASGRPAPFDELHHAVDLIVMATVRKGQKPVVAPRSDAALVCGLDGQGMDVFGIPGDRAGRQVWSAAAGSPENSRRDFMDRAGWRDLHEHFGKRNSVYRQFQRLAKVSLSEVMLDVLNEGGGPPAAVHIINGT